MVTLDGVIQAPGLPDEDTEGGFEFGGWVAPFQSDELGKILEEHVEAADLLRGRRTFEIFEAYWPKRSEFWPGVNEVNKYVLSHARSESTWQNCHFFQDIEDIKALKSSGDKILKVWGSSQLILLLMEHDMVDEFWLQICPVVLGKGKRLFNDGHISGAYKIIDTYIAPKGVIVARYQRNGPVITGSMDEI